MNKRIALLFISILVCVLLLGSLATHSLAFTADNAPARAITVQSATLSGGNYQLNPTGWHISGSLSGPGYQLEVATSPDGTGTPCCCNMLPCILR